MPVFMAHAFSPFVPAKAGIQSHKFDCLRCLWMPASAGTNG